MGAPFKDVRNFWVGLRMPNKTRNVPKSAVVATVAAAVETRLFATSLVANPAEVGLVGGTRDLMRGPVGAVTSLSAVRNIADPGAVEESSPVRLLRSTALVAAFFRHRRLLSDGKKRANLVPNSQTNPRSQPRARGVCTGARPRLSTQRVVPPNTEHVNSKRNPEPPKKEYDAHAGYTPGRDGPLSDSLVPPYLSL